MVARAPAPKRLSPRGRDRSAKFHLYRRPYLSAESSVKGDQRRGAVRTVARCRRGRAGCLLPSEKPDLGGRAARGARKILRLRALAAHQQDRERSRNRARQCPAQVVFRRGGTAVHDLPLGGSAVCAVTRDTNLLVKAIADWGESVNSLNRLQREFEFMLLPGVRQAFNFTVDAQLVIGAGGPLVFRVVEYGCLFLSGLRAQVLGTRAAPAVMPMTFAGTASAGRPTAAPPGHGDRLASLERPKGGRGPRPPRRLLFA